MVSCTSSGGRPGTDISLVLDSGEEPQRNDEADSDTQTSSYFLPAAAYEGQNATCTFGHPKFPHPVSKVQTLPSFCEYLCVLSIQLRLEMKRGRVLPSADISGVWWFRSGLGDSSSGSMELQEGQTDVVIGLRVSGNIPRYNLSCSRREKRQNSLFVVLNWFYFETSRFVF